MGEPYPASRRDSDHSEGVRREGARQGGRTGKGGRERGRGGGGREEGEGREGGEEVERDDLIVL